MPQMVKQRPENPLTFFSLEDFPGKTRIVVPLPVHDWIKGKIMQSLEWGERMGQHPDTAESPYQGQEQQTQGAIENDPPF